MPLPMVHLAIAVRLFTMYDRTPSPAFALGSLAPDAIHMRPNVTRADKHMTHLGDPSAITDDRGIVDLLHHGSPQVDDDFIAGYAAHILADRIWAATVISQLSDALPRTIPPDEWKTVYYQETDQIDFNLYYHAVWRPTIWTALADAVPGDFPPWLAATEIGAWRDRTLAWFDTLKQEPQITPEHITDAGVEAFITETTEVIHEKFTMWHVPLVR